MAKRPWRRNDSRGIGYRSVKKIADRKNIYIFVNGKKTEYNYFNDLVKMLRTKNIKNPIHIKCHDKDPETAAKQVAREIENKQYNGIFWLVFDIDPQGFSEENIRNCCRILQNKEIEIAYSNKSFELWFILHYCSDPSKDWNQKEYEKKLSQYLRKEYKKTNSIFDDIYPLNDAAIKNAKNILAQHNNGVAIYHRDPSTTVHLLVEQLIEQIKF